MSDQEWNYGALAIEVSAAKTEIERLQSSLVSAGKTITGLDAEIKQLKALLTRAADALEAWNCAGFYDKLIAELRKAAFRWRN